MSKVNEVWELGNFVCDTFVAVDVTCSTASILNLVAISIDRYLAVAHPLAYSASSSKTRAILTIFVVWLISCCVGAPIILGLNTSPERISTLCILYNSTFIFWSSLTSFYAPCIIMIGLYWRIFSAIRSRTKKAIQAAHQNQHQTQQQSSSRRRPPAAKTGEQANAKAIAVSIGPNLALEPKMLATTPGGEQTSELLADATENEQPAKTAEEPPNCNHRPNLSPAPTGAPASTPEQRNFVRSSFPARKERLKSASQSAGSFNSLPSDSSSMSDEEGEEEEEEEEEEEDDEEEEEGEGRPEVRRRSVGSGSGSSSSGNCRSSGGHRLSGCSSGARSLCQLAASSALVAGSPSGCCCDRLAVMGASEMAPERAEDVNQARGRCSLQLADTSSVCDCTPLSSPLPPAHDNSSVGSHEQQPEPCEVATKETRLKAPTTGSFHRRSLKLGRLRLGLGRSASPAPQPANLNALTSSSNSTSVPQTSGSGHPGSCNSISGATNQLNSSHLNSTTKTTTHMNLLELSTSKEICVPSSRLELESMSLTPAAPAEVASGKLEVANVSSAAAKLSSMLCLTPSLPGGASSVARVPPFSSIKLASGNSPSHLRRRGAGSRRRREKNAARQERKATKTLAIVLGIFLICWTPFFTCNIIDGICIQLNMGCRPGMMVYLATSWLGYINSCVNPIIYTIFNMDFRRAFKRILTTKPQC